MKRDAHGWPANLPPVRVQWSGYRGRICDVRGEKETKMGNDNRNDRSNAPKAEPWNLSLLVSETRQDGTTHEHWEQIGTAWKMKERDGFTWTQHVQVPAGSRMAVMPRKRTNGGER